MAIRAAADPEAVRGGRAARGFSASERAREGIRKWRLSTGQVDAGGHRAPARGHAGAVQLGRSTSASAGPKMERGWPPRHPGCRLSGPRERAAGRAGDWGKHQIYERIRGDRRAAGARPPTNGRRGRGVGRHPGAA